MKFVDLFVSLILIIVIGLYAFLLVYAFPHWLDEMGPGGSVTLNIISTSIDFLVISVVGAGLYGRLKSSRKRRLEQEKQEATQRQKAEIVGLLESSAPMMHEAIMMLSQNLKCLSILCTLKVSMTLCKNGEMEDDDNLLKSKFRKEFHEYATSLHQMEEIKNEFEFHADLYSNQFSDMRAQEIEHIFIFHRLIAGMVSGSKRSMELLETLESSSEMYVEFSRCRAATRVMHYTTFYVRKQVNELLATSAFGDYADSHETWKELADSIANSGTAMAAELKAFLDEYMPEENEEEHADASSS